jgi:uncharacterized protein YfcZ (UPF0381/DUF406 family)
MSTSGGDNALPLGQSKCYWLIDFHFLNVLVRAYGKKSRLPFSTHFSQYCDFSQGTRTLRRMLEIVLDYDMESDLQEMQTITAQDIKTFTEARDCLVHQAEPFHLREQLEAVIKHLKKIRATMEAPEDAGNEHITDLEKRLQAITVDACKSLVINNGDAMRNTNWDKKFRATKLRWLVTNGGRIDNDMFQYSPYTRQMKTEIGMPTWHSLGRSSNTSLTNRYRSNHSTSLAHCHDQTLRLSGLYWFSSATIWMRSATVTPTSRSS